MSCVTCFFSGRGCWQDIDLDLKAFISQVMDLTRYRYREQLGCRYRRWRLPGRGRLFWLTTDRAVAIVGRCRTTTDKHFGAGRFAHRSGSASGSGSGRSGRLGRANSRRALQLLLLIQFLFEQLSFPLRLFVAFGFEFGARFVLCTACRNSINR
jgi:hypothetical protein